MDGMYYPRDFHGAPPAGISDRDAKITAIVMTGLFFVAMIALTLALHWLGWTPIVDADLMAP